MKTIFKVFVATISSVLMFTQCEKEPGPNDPVEIPDDEFLRYLILDGVDTNGDGLISYGEAEKVTKIYLDPDSTGRRNGKVSSVEGIEAFINLDTLHCCSNQIQELDVSANTELRLLVCWNGDENDQLERLNISNNMKLEHISIPGNLLTDLDVSNNPSLYKLMCSYNQLTNLDVSNNTNLGQLWCDGNQIARLDISNNINLGKGNEPWIVRINPAVSIRDMPTLAEVCVWTMPFPPTEMEIDTTGSPNVYFTTECSE
ncbi:MAG: hypothetical protein ABFS32_22240 [Bacteroidota bacterium]